MLRKVRLPTPDQVANGSRFTVKMPVGPTYVRVDLKLGGTFTPAHITNLEFSINGRPIQRFASGSDLDKMNQRLGRPAASTNGILTFYFRRTELEEVEDAELFDIGTARPDPANPLDFNSVIVETVTITGDVSGATSPTMEAWAMQSSKLRPLRMMTKILNFPKTFTVSASPGTEGDFDAYPIGYPNAVLLGVHLKETVDNTITKVRATANIAGASMELLENVDVAQLINADSGATRAKTTQAGWVHWDLCESGQVMDGLPLNALSDLRTRLTCAHATNTSESVTVYVDMVDTFQGA